MKNTILSTVANYNISILDLYYFLEENNYKGFENGHFLKSYHKRLSTYIDNNFINKTNKLLEPSREGAELKEKLSKLNTKITNIQSYRNRLLNIKEIQYQQ